jgi:hypothetical protein
VIVPTAVQSVLEVHATALKIPLGVLGVVWIVQWSPSQASARAPGPSGPKADPTAVQAVADGHDTPVRTPSEIDAGSGIVWEVQPDPLQRSANSSALGAIDPTAVHAVGAAHETANRPPRLGGFWSDHVFPCQLSAAPPPTAMQLVSDAHEIPMSCPGPAGVSWIDQVRPSQRSISGTD